MWGGGSFFFFLFLFPSFEGCLTTLSLSLSFFPLASPNTFFVAASNSADGSGDPPPIFVVNIQRPATYNGPASFSRGSVLNQPIDFIYGHVPPPPSKKTWTIYIGIAAALVLLVLASVMIWRRRRNQRKLSPHLGEMKQ